MRRCVSCVQTHVLNWICASRSTNDRDLQYPVALRAATVVLFAMSGTAVALALSTALGDATWSLSTGLGSCLIAGIYEVGRPERLSAEEADQLDEQYKDFCEPSYGAISFSAT